MFPKPTTTDWKVNHSNYSVLEILAKLGVFNPKTSYANKTLWKESEDNLTTSLVSCKFMPFYRQFLLTIGQLVLAFPEGVENGRFSRKVERVCRGS